MVGGWCTFFHVLKQLVFLVLTAEGWWYIRQSTDFALSPHDVMYSPHAPPPGQRGVIAKIAKYESPFLHDRDCIYI